MVKNDKEIIAKLTSLEALLEAGLSECHRLRMLIEAGVSTPATGQRALQPKHIASVIAERHKRLGQMKAAAVNKPNNSTKKRL